MRIHCGREWGPCFKMTDFINAYLPLERTNSSINMHHRQIFSANQNMVTHGNLHRNFIWPFQPIEVRDYSTHGEVGRTILHRTKRSTDPLSRRHIKSSTMRFSGLFDSIETRSEPASHVHFPPMTSTTLPATPATRFSADDANSIVDRLSEYEPEKVPNINGYPVKLCMPILYKKNYRDSELKVLVNKLHNYDPDKYASDHMGVAPRILMTLPKQTMIKMTKCSAGQVEDIVEKLYKCDLSRSPKEARLGYGSRCSLESRLSKNGSWEARSGLQTRKSWQPEFKASGRRLNK